MLYGGTRDALFQLRGVLVRDKRVIQEQRKGEGRPPLDSLGLPPSLAFPGNCTVSSFFSSPLPPDPFLSETFHLCLQPGARVAGSVLREGHRKAIFTNVLNYLQFSSSRTSTGTTTSSSRPSRSRTSAWPGSPGAPRGCPPPAPTPGWRRRSSRRPPSQSPATCGATASCFGSS